MAPRMVLWRIKDLSRSVMLHRYDLRNIIRRILDLYPSTVSNWFVHFSVSFVKFSLTGRKPSDDDIRITKKLYDCGQLLGIGLRDSIIIGGILTIRSRKKGGCRALPTTAQPITLQYSHVLSLQQRPQTTILILHSLRLSLGFAGTKSLVFGIFALQFMHHLGILPPPLLYSQKSRCRFPSSAHLISSSANFKVRSG